MLYELRLYQVGLGRLDDVAARMRDLVPAAFEKHGFPVPLGQWIASAGPKLPLYLWLLQWPDSDVRAKAFASLYADPAWQDIRARTNGPRETVLKYDIYFMQGTSAAATIRQQHGAGAATDALHELRLHDVFPGKTGAALQRLCATDLPAWKKAGATTLGVFDVQAGPAMPGIAHFLTWPSYEARERGLTEFAADPAVSALNQAEADEIKTHVLGRADTWLMRPMEFCPPLLGFASRNW